MEIVVAELAGVAAATVITLCVIPQVVSTVRSRDVGGVSVHAAALSAASCAAWAVYAFAVGLTVAGLSSALGFFLWGLVAAVTGARNREAPSGWILLWVLVVGVAAWFGGLPALGTLLLAEALTTTVPQAVRVRHATEGVSLSTYVLMLSAALLWVVYASAAGDLLLTVSSLVKASVCSYIILRVWMGRRRQGAEGVLVP